MSLGLLGKKIGMTHVYLEDGTAQPVTVIEVAGNTVMQKKTNETDGYTAVQVGFDDQKEQRLNKPELGHVKKYGATAKKYVREFRVDSEGDFPEEQVLPITTFEKDQVVDVISTSKGKGFQGVYKRYSFGGLRATHGSMMHRRTGAIAAGSTPGRVWKNQKMPGRHGNYNCTEQNLKVVQVREEDGVILISGSIAGSKGGYCVIRPSIKSAARAKAGKKS